MSAHIVEHNTINALVGFYMARTRFNHVNPNDIAQILIDENYRSVNHRYKEDNAPEKSTYSDKWELGSDLFSAAQILKLCAYYDYQSCETDDYKTTKAYLVIDRIKDEAINALPGYLSADFGLDDDNPIVKSINKSNVIKLSSLI